jgi:uncharacterized protein (DUF433 family)
VRRVYHEPLPCSRSEFRVHDSQRRYALFVAFERITTDPDVMGGLPCIRGMRMPVATVVGMVADGMPVAEILDDFPDLEAEDVAEALRAGPGSHA